MRRVNENNLNEILGKFLIANYDNKVIVTSNKIYVTLNERLSLAIKISKIVS